MARSGTEAVEGLVARGFVMGFCLFVYGEAVGKLGAVVGEDRVDLECEARRGAREETGGGLGSAIGQDFEIDEAGGAVDAT